ncbi:hypothetical protein MM710_38540, partial [Klebsiella pneumoniae]|nr:hypothetical protein [Klebsiella pneumoniae]
VAEKAGEAVAIFRILVEAAVDFARRAPPCAQGLRFERGNIVALLHDFDDFENVFGPSEKNIGFMAGSSRPLWVAFALLLVSCILFMTLNVKGDWDFVLHL